MKFGVYIFCVRASSFDWFKILGRNLNLTWVVNDINITYPLNFPLFLTGLISL